MEVSPLGFIVDLQPDVASSLSERHVIARHLPALNWVSALSDSPIAAAGTILRIRPAGPPGFAANDKVALPTAGTIARSVHR